MQSTVMITAAVNAMMATNAYPPTPSNRIMAPLYIPDAWLPCPIPLSRTTKRRQTERTTLHAPITPVFRRSCMRRRAAIFSCKAAMRFSSVIIGQPSCISLSPIMCTEQRKNPNPNAKKKRFFKRMEILFRAWRFSPGKTTDRPKPPTAESDCRSRRSHRSD